MKTSAFMFARQTARSDTPFSPCGRIAVVASATHYRKLAKTEVRRNDRVLEIGCSSGLATAVLARTGATVAAVDCAQEQVDLAISRCGKQPNLTIARLDGRNADLLVGIMPEPTVIFIDVGGNALLDNVAYMIRLCLRVFSPRLMVVRSIEYAGVTAMIDSLETLEHRPIRRISRRSRSAFLLRCLIEQSHSDKADNRVFTIYRLHALGTAPARRRVAQLAADPHPRVRRVARMCLDDWGAVDRPLEPDDGGT